MATYHLTIDLDNAAFWDSDDNFVGAELARILRAEAEDAETATDIADDADPCDIPDRNGNICGRVWTDR